MDAKSSANHARGGFTLIELLAVIVIMGILVAMISAAAWKAMDSAKQATYSMDMAQLRRALDEYKDAMGEYPPDFTDAAAVTAHIRRVFPDYQGDWQTDLAGKIDNIGQQDSASALVFWLGGVPATSGGTRMIGFSKNPFNPFDANEARIGPFFQFKAERLGYEGGSCKYFPEQGKNEKFGPYVYFRAERRQGAEYAGKLWSNSVYPQWGTTAAHTDSKLGDWVNPDSFQIHAPGLDGKHGAGASYPDGTDYGEDDFDDQTDFSGGPLNNKIP